MIFTVGIIFTLLAVAIVSYFITRYVFFEDSFLLSSVYEDFGDCKANQVKSGHLMFFFFHKEKYTVRACFGGGILFTYSGTDPIKRIPKSSTKNPPKIIKNILTRQ